MSTQVSPPLQRHVDGVSSPKFRFRITSVREKHILDTLVKSLPRSWLSRLEKLRPLSPLVLIPLASVSGPGRSSTCI